MQTDLDLVRACAANNRLGQEQLFRIYYPSLILMCKRFFTDEHQALEALNDGMIKVFKKIATYDSTKGELFNWIYTIVRNSALDKIRLVKFPKITELTEGIYNPGTENPFEKLEWKDLYVLLDTLPPATRVVCSLYYVEGFSVKEIGNQLCVHEGTIKWHLSETRKKLKPALEKYYF